MDEDDAATVRVERGEPDYPGFIALMEGGREVLRISTGKAAEAVIDCGSHTFEVRFEHIAKPASMPPIDFPPRGRLTLRLGVTPQPLWRRILGLPPKVVADLIEEAPRPQKMLTTQFWVGNADSKDAFWAVFGEREFPEPQTDEEQWAQDDTPISLFAELQDEIFIDHDFTEGAFVGDEGPWVERLRGHSWSQHWAGEVLKRAEVAGHPAPNAFFLCGIETHGPNRPRPQVRKPCDVEADGVRLAYVGEVTHRA